MLAQVHDVMSTDTEIADDGGKLLQHDAARHLGCCVDRQYGSPRGCKPATCMGIPDGKTCADCVHVQRCEAFGFTSSTANGYCSFFPRRFHHEGVTP